MIRSIGTRLGVLALAVGLIAILPASAGAAKPRAKTKIEVVNAPFALSENFDEDQADGAATCPRRTTLLSGGALSNTPAPVDPPLATEIYISGPISNAWYVRYETDTPTDTQPSAQAICLRDRLKVTGLEGAAKSAGTSMATAAATPKAITKVTRVDTAFTLPLSVAPTNGIAQFDVPCPNGTKIAGGGAWFSQSGDTDAQLYESGPQGNGWHIRYDNDEAAVAVTGIASALCLKSKLKIEDENDKARSKIEQVDQAVTLPDAATNSGRARFTTACPEGTTVVGGGAKLDPAAPLADTDIQLEESGAVDNGWQVTLDNDEVVAQSASAHALCLKKKLKVN